MPAETLEAWAAAPPHAALHLPPPNRFLPDDLAILPAAPAPASPASPDAPDAADAADDDADAASASAGLRRPRRPTQLSPPDAAGRTVWHLDGDAYARPRGSALVLLGTPQP